MFDRVFALWVLRWSNRRARDHRNHVAPRRKPIPTSQRSQLTKTLLWTRNLFQNQTVFSPTFMCRSVGISRICRLKKFQNPTVHAYRSYRKESAYAVSEEIDLQKRSNPPHHENENDEQMETWRVHQSESLRDRRAIEKPEAVTRHSEESQRRKTRTCISQKPCLSFREQSREHHLLGAWKRNTAQLFATLKKHLKKAFRL